MTHWVAPLIFVGCMPDEGAWPEVERWIAPPPAVEAPAPEVVELLEAVERWDPYTTDRLATWLGSEPALPRDRPCALARAIADDDQTWPRMPVWAYRAGRRLVDAGLPELGLRLGRHMTKHADERVNWSLGAVVVLEAMAAGARDGAPPPTSDALFDVMVLEAWCMDQTSVALEAEQAEQWSTARLWQFAQRQRRWQRHENAHALVALHPVRHDSEAMEEVAAGIDRANQARGRTTYGLLSDFFLLGFEDAAALVRGTLPATLPEP